MGRVGCGNRGAATLLARERIMGRYKWAAEESSYGL